MIENNCLLALDQDVEGEHRWSLPGGKVEPNETLHDALKREMKEETGLDAEIEKLLYICDHITDNQHIVHITFLLSKTGGSLGEVTPGLDTNEIREVRFVPIEKLTELGFSEKFQQLVEQGFPNAGSYMGPKSAIGL